MTEVLTTNRPRTSRVTVAVAPPPAHRFVRFLPAALSGATMLGISLVQAGRPALSWDEVTSAEVSQRTVPQIWEMVQNIDAVFGFYYVFLHYWSALAGTSELMLRLPSILAMAAGVAVTAELGRRLFTPMIGLTAGLILSVLPNTSRYAAEARPYAFACFFAMLAVLFLVVAVRRGGAYRWAGYGLSVVLLGLFHLVALTTLAAHAVLVGLFVRHTRRRRVAMVWTGTILAAMVPLLPVAYLGLHQEDTQLHWVQPITVAGIRAMPGEIVGSRDAAWLLIGIAVLASWRPLRRLAPTAVLALGPLAVLAVVSALISPMWVARYLLVVLAPLAILAAVALAGGRRHRAGAVRIVAVLLLLAAVVMPAQRAVRTPSAKNGPDYRAAARIIGDRQQPGDVVVYTPENRAIRAGMDYYLSRLPAQPADPLIRVPSAASARLIAEEYPDDAVRVTGTRRIWLVLGDQRDDPVTARPTLRELLDREYRRVGFWQPKRATLALYERTRAS
ncbi:glycosyltransferase family 39 protein [Actinoplanes sp. NBC_00393]|uniref:glycosyltransferase family 39 protein n=1 Tax=Actinoplanes sp. NBC_00393 TaxID=2975953 RepID=UPI002E22F953